MISLSGFNIVVIASVILYLIGVGVIIYSIKWINKTEKAPEDPE